MNHNFTKICIIEAQSIKMDILALALANLFSTFDSLRVKFTMGVCRRSMRLLSLLFVLGWLLFGFASLQARVVNRGASILLIIGSVLLIVGFLMEFPVGATIIFDAAVAWLGYSLWSIPSESASIAEATA